MSLPVDFRTWTREIMLQFALKEYQVDLSGEPNKASIIDKIMDIHSALNTISDEPEIIIETLDIPITKITRFPDYIQYVKNPEGRVFQMHELLRTDVNYLIACDKDGNTIKI